MRRVTDVPAVVAELRRHSLRIGADLRLVQGAGGNLSVTTDGVLWIKASGTRLAQADEREIYVPMDAAATREAVLVTEDLWSCVLPREATADLRPSIETALHALLPHPVVFHAHGVGSIAVGLTDDVHHAIGRIPQDVDVVVVPYAKPGLQLARAVLARTPADLSADRPVVLVLRNHGLVVGASDADAAGELLDAVEQAFRSANAPDCSLDPTEPRLCPPGTVDPAAADVLRAGALTPDSAVFLGPVPFGSGEPAAPPVDSPHAAVVADDGSVWLRADLGPDEREVAASMVDVARQVRGGPVSVLSADDVHELVNWEAEKWRKALKR